jgi:hypothetical protein
MMWMKKCGEAAPVEIMRVEDGPFFFPLERQRAAATRSRRTVSAARMEGAKVYAHQQEKFLGWLSGKG